MTRTRLIRRGGNVAAKGLVDSFLEPKLHPPPTREHWVERTRLLDRLDHATHQPVTLVAAPAGYGKTTLVSQWLARGSGPSAAWISLDAGDNDPARLWTHVAAALQRAGCDLAADAAASMPSNSGELVTGVLPTMINALAAMPEDLIILFDDFHVLHEPACRDDVEFLVENLPPQAHLMIITRADPGLRLGRLRASGRLAELRAADLSFDADEASTLLAAEKVNLSDDAAAVLMTRTEGWPAGLYLATLSLAGLADPDEFVHRFSGSNRFIVDYLIEEVLSRHTADVRDFVLTMSILDRFCAPLCDFIAEITDSASMLRDLERTNLFLVPLDDEPHWFRFHHLFAEIARGELEVAHPNRLHALHARAAEWFRDHGHIDEAIEHSFAAGRISDAVLLMQTNWVTYVNAGRTETVLGWLEALEGNPFATDPATHVMAAWLAAWCGDESALVEHLNILVESQNDGPLPDGSHSVESSIAMIRGLVGHEGPIEMSEGARRAVELETDGRSPYHAIAHLALGHSAYVAGDLDLAKSVLATSSHSEAAPPIISVISLSVESLVESERGRPRTSRELAELATETVDAYGLRAMPQASMAFTALGQAQAAAGKITDAMSTLEQGLALRLRSPVLGPWGPIHHLLVTARVAISDGQLTMAQELVADATDRMSRYRDGMGPMRARLAAVQDVIDLHGAPGRSVEPLTDRELEVLRLLGGSLNLREMADGLCLSLNTIKTHTRAIYRKLDVHSRIAAVRIAREHHLT